MLARVLAIHAAAAEPAMVIACNWQAREDHAHLLLCIKLLEVGTGLTSTDWKQLVISLTDSIKRQQL